MTEASTEKKRLHKGKAIGEAFRFVFTNIPHLIATSALTLIVLAAFSLLFNLFFGAALVEGMVDAQMPALLAGDVMGASIAPMIYMFTDPATIIYTLLSIFLSLVLGGIFAIRWHRSALFGSDAEGTGFGLEFSSSLIKYVTRLIALYLLVIALIVVPSILAGIVPFAAPLVLVGAIAALYVSGRLSLALPAAALDIENMDLEGSWQQTSGHGWGIFFANIFMSLIMVAIAVVFSLLMIPFVGTGAADLGTLGGSSSDLRDTLIAQQQAQLIPTALISFITIPLLTGLTTSFLSYVYFQLGKPPAWVEESRAG